MEKEAPRPLADRLRPRKLAEVVGQDHLVGAGGTLTRMLKSGRLQSMILWGPPGTGKTTVARLLADETQLAFEQLSAIFSGVQDLRKAFDRAKSRRETGKGTLLFIDEIHRFNRCAAGQLPAAHGGRHHHARRRHDREPLLRAQRRAAVARAGAGVPPARRGRARAAAGARRDRRRAGRCRSMQEARETLKAMARRRRPHGAQHGRGAVYGSVATGASRLDRAALTELVQRRAPLYDKSRDGHYNLISALHKSVRGSDPDAALYWLARMLDGGEDRLYIARRLVRMAIEDIGLADPQAVSRPWRPRRPSTSWARPRASWRWRRPSSIWPRRPNRTRPTSPSARPCAAAKEGGSLAPPKHILNAPTRLMKEEGYGAGYDYDHDAPEALLRPELLPRRHGARAVLRPRRPRLRGGDQDAAGGTGPSCARSGAADSYLSSRPEREARRAGTLGELARCWVPDIRFANSGMTAISRLSRTRGRDRSATCRAC